MKIRALGQSGFVLETPETRIVIDPYLSDAVAEQFGEAFRRQIPVVISPADFVEVDWILLTHAHLDHTDPATLGPLAEASPRARFVAPDEARSVLAEAGLGARVAVVPPTEWMSLGPDVSLRAVPAAHTELEAGMDDRWRYVGYLLRFGERTLYHAGDTVPHEAIFESLAGESIDWALLPVNERNFYRDRDGIVGNMTVREAFRMAADIGAKTLVPIHWDLFAPNRTHPEEIELLHRLERPPFALEFLPAGATKSLDVLSSESTDA